jgi:V/A-type H+-transporting ATPase subunit I
MAKIRVIGHRSRLDETLRLLYRLRVVQIEEMGERPAPPLAPLPMDEERQRRLEELRELHARLDGLLRLLPADAGADGPAPSFSTGEVPALQAELDELAPRVERLVRRLDDLRADQAALPRHLQSLGRLLPLVADLDELETYETVVLLLERRHAGLLGLLDEELERLVGPRHELRSAMVDPETVGAVLVVPRAESTQLDALLGHERVRRVRLPAEFAGLPMRRALAVMQRRLATIPYEIDAAKRELAGLLGPRLTRWRAARVFLDGRLDQLAVTRQLATTGHTFVLLGWVPHTRIPELERALAAEVGGDVLVSELPIGPGDWDRVPLLLANPPIARPFERLLRLLALPRYGTTDPTGLMALFLPLFFGMMLGDVGYGTVLAALALAGRRRLGARSPFVRDLAAILLMGAAWAVIWGVVFGELFGDLGTRLGMRPLWQSREEALEPLLFFAVTVGAAHVTLGLLLGLWVAWKTRRRGRVMEKAGMLTVLAGLFAAVGAAAGGLPTQVAMVGVAATVVGLVALVRAQGALLAPMEVLDTFGNILSYLRIAAIGLASVYLARVANELAVATPTLWVGVLVAALLHALNLLLGAFSPTIQALRLHLVEFFGKFYEPGGRAFEPFGGRLGGEIQ